MEQRPHKNETEFNFITIFYFYENYIKKLMNHMCKTLIYKSYIYHKVSKIHPFRLLLFTSKILTSFQYISWPLLMLCRIITERKLLLIIFFYFLSNNNVRSHKRIPCCCFRADTCRAFRKLFILWTSTPDGT